MSRIIEDKVINFITHLPSNANPYQAAADCLATFLLPYPLPSWSRYLQRVYAVTFLMMFFQSIYVLYVRSKTKRLYHIGLNSMGLLQLDRANHCGLCYFLYSIIALSEIICEELVQSGQLDQGWPNFLLGIKLTLTVICARVILWLCICHCALDALRRKNQRGQVLSKTVTWAMNTFLVIILFAPAVQIIISFYQVTMEYQHIRKMVTGIIDIYRDLAPSCSLVKCSVTQTIPQLVSHWSVLHHVDLLEYYTTLGSDSYLFICGIVLLVYVPFLFLLSRSFNDQEGLESSLKKQQEGVFSNTLLEFTIILLLLILVSCETSLVHKGDFIYNSSFWLISRIGIGGVISTLGNTALFLILCSLYRTNLAHQDTHIVMPEIPVPVAVYHKSSEEVSV
ncbi:uncharacterized protein MELLADRAFT_57656 [Melampsora larici-populina 98AG31]|uniref:Uncharacterized protein n=1 Tax=Melampsora larici-populina (strain 98AG31 / pathotype 3-4-7) TaxID=747676 RepID=F4S541_MELLP|nr:uncharacterized protein MELLADRAFT_57656 [Melampsora larici-populina 98AG31]EGG00273.1 hypothetical protein MELLADRAFT_57656 [Melampsora larici-populina 98AG31]